MKSLRNDLQAANERYLQGVDSVEAAAENKKRQSLAGGQSPQVMVLSCADSRVPVERVLSGAPGDYFVVRSAGNVAETSQIASLEYGAAVLGAKTLLVLGHTSCGAVSAAVDYVREHAELPSKALNALAEMIAPAVKKVETDANKAETIDSAIVENVKHQIVVLREQSDILRSRVESGELEMLGAVYDLASGAIRFID